jgi:tripartite-type tricarboxylate transporter receptor subunit TctC
MKKLLAVLIASLITSVVAEPVKIPSVWPFAVGSTQGLYFRAILEQANKEQTKYQFQFEHKPGAGGAIGSKYVYDQYPKIAILAQGPSFFVRPFLYPDTSYSLDQFKPLIIMGISPAVLVTKQKSLDQLIKQQKITFGTPGAGTLTHLTIENVARSLKGKDIAIIHYKDSNEAFNAVMGGHIDASFEFLGDAKSRALPDTRILGLTGKVSHDKLPLLKDQGFKFMENLGFVFAIYVPNQLPNETIKELQTILLKAEKHESVQKLYQSDYATKDAFMQSPNDLTDWYKATIEQFKVLTNGIKLN